MGIRADLHRHLDGSLRRSTFLELADEQSKAMLKLLDEAEFRMPGLAAD